MSSVTSTSSSTNVTRITGMATGMDTDAMVKAMTANYQTKIDKASQDEQIIQWKQEAYRGIIKDIKNLQDYFDPLSSKYIMSDSKFNPIKVTNSSDSTVGFTASSSAQTGNYKINIAKLAQPAVLKGTAITAATSTKLEGGLGITDGSQLTFNISGKSVTTDAVDANTTIQNVLDKINNDAGISGLGVTASFDELSKKFIFSTKDSGASSNLTNVSVTSTTVGEQSKLGLSTLQDISGANQTSVTGQNAQFDLTYPDGRTETITNQTSNQFTANGITYNLKSVGSADITVSKNDVDSVVTNLKSFITDYNNVIGEIQGKLTEKKQYTYKPLTDDQKKDMKDADIANWESKCKQGILSNDSYLENMLTNLRTVFGDGVYSSVNSVGGTGHREGSNTVDGTKNEFVMGIYGDGALGLDTSKEVADAGKIIISDENKLRDAIAKDPVAFANFFTQKSSTSLQQLKDTDGTTLLKNPDGTPKMEEYAGSKKYFEDGIFARLDTIVRKYAGDPGIGKDGTSTLKGYLNIFANKQYDYSLTGSNGQNTMPDQIYAKALSIDKLQKQMTDAQNRYYAKFAALETAMNNMNSQLSNFKSQMGIS